MKKSIFVFADVYAMLGDFANQSTAVQCLQRFGLREQQETNMIRQNPKLNIIQVRFSFFSSFCPHFASLMEYICKIEAGFSLLQWTDNTL